MNDPGVFLHVFPSSQEMFIVTHSSISIEGKISHIMHAERMSIILGSFYRPILVLFDVSNNDITG